MAVLKKLEENSCIFRIKKNVFQICPLIVNHCFKPCLKLLSMLFTSDAICEKYANQVELLKKHPKALEGKSDKSDEGWSLILREILLKKVADGTVLNSAIELFSFLPVVDKLKRPISEIQNLVAAFQEFDKDDEEKLEAFKQEQEKTLVESDYIAGALNNKIKTLKADKKSVLILDDFERIDPEHVFKVLNHLSAHMEGDEENMLGFDRVILVGDVRNIRSIFHHKYGSKTEFEGYFDKFFTKQIFEFDNRAAVSESIPVLLQKVHQKYGRVVADFLDEILVWTNEMGEISLRQLYKVVEQVKLKTKISSSPVEESYKMRSYRKKYGRNFDGDDGEHVRCLEILDVGNELLGLIFGSRDVYLEKLKLLRKKKVNTVEDGGHKESHREMFVSALFYALGDDRFALTGNSPTEESLSAIQRFYNLLIAYVEKAW